MLSLSFDVILLRGRDQYSLLNKDIHVIKSEFYIVINAHVKRYSDC